jgi:hypothetical protein
MKPQQATSRTTSQFNYEGMVFSGPDDTVIIGAQFFRGRIDSYRVDYSPANVKRILPKHTKQRSKEDLRMSPVGILASPPRMMTEPETAGRFLYVSGGAFNRVLAFPLGPEGFLLNNGAGPSSKTDELEDSFPNDVAVAVLSAGCP